MPVYEGEFRTKGGHPGKAALMNFGCVLPVEVTIPSALAKFLESQNRPIPAPEVGVALIDTGATRSAVDSIVISTIGVNPIGVAFLGTASGRSQHNLYPAKFRFPAIRFELEFSSVFGVDLRQQSVGNSRLIVLIGRDVLAECLLVYNGPRGSFSLAI